MKNLFSFITLLIFVNIITNNKIGTQAKEDLPDAVLDSSGRKLLAGSNYFILPVSPGMGGGLAAAIVEGICVYAVAQQKLDTNPGQLLTFFPDGRKLGGVVRESTDLNIGFSLSIGCRPSSIWKVGDYDESTKQNFIMLGGSVGNPGNETVNNWFKFEKHTSGDYKIVFCPSVCAFCAVRCSDVGIYIQNGMRRLALSDTPFLVRFQRFTGGTEVGRRVVSV